MKFGPPIVLLLFAAPSVELVFAPEADLELTKRFTVDVSSATDASDLSIGDNEIPFKLGMRSSRSFELVVADAYTGVGDGRALELVRSFETVQVERSHENVPDNVQVSEDLESTGMLEGLSVRFVWNADGGEYETTFEGTGEELETDEDWLDGLTEDLDFRALLPEDEVEAGGAWDIELGLLELVLRPGGSMAWDDDSDEEAGDGEELRIVLPGVGIEQFFSDLDGDAMATLTSIDGNLATVTIELALEAETDLTEHFTEVLGESGETTREFDEAEGTLGLEGTATLIWDSARGTFASFSLEADLETSLDVTWTNSRIEADELTYYSEESGTFVLEAEVVE